MASRENDDTWWYRTPIILHDNARSHTAAVTVLLRRWKWEILEHPRNKWYTNCGTIEINIHSFIHSLKAKYSVGIV